jgi:autotransporter passenger strand-loop-strand repeat protein
MGFVVSGGNSPHDVNDTTEVGTTIQEAGFLRVTTDGLIINTVVAATPFFSDSQLTVGGFFGGELQTNAVAVGTTLIGATNGSAEMFVSAGGTAFQTTVNAGTFMGVSGGTASNTTVNAGGTMSVANDDSERPGVAVGTIVNGVGGLTANLFVEDGGHTFGTVVNFNGIEAVEGSEDDDGNGDPGTATGTTVNSGGHQLVSEGGFSFSTVVNQGGAQLVFGADNPTEGPEAPGQAIGTTLNGGDQVLGQIFDGDSFGTTINGGGAEVVFNGSAGGTQVVKGTLVDWGPGTTNAVTGQLFAGFSNNATAGAGGFITVFGAFAEDDNSTLNGGGEFVLDNAFVFGTTVNAGGVLTLTGSASSLPLSSTASDVTINRGGTEVINSDAVDFNAIVGGTQFVESGGFAENADVVAGGIQSVLAGGVAFNTLIDGGNVEFAAAGSGSTVSFNSDNGGVLILDNSQSFVGTIANFGSPPGVTEKIELRDIGVGGHVVGFTQTGTSGTLTVADTAGHTANLTLLGTFSAAQFTASFAAGSGTVITDPALVASGTTLATHG